MPPSRADDPSTATRRGRSPPDPRRPQRTLREAARHGARAVLLCSFQKEESVLLDELLRLEPGGSRVRSSRSTPACSSRRRCRPGARFEERFGVTIEVAGRRGPGEPWTGPEHCCSAAKVAALERALRRRRRVDHRHPPRAGADAGRDRARRARRQARASGSTTRSPTGPSKDLGGASTSATCPTTRCTTRATSRSAARRARSPGTGREGRWAGTDKTECGCTSRCRPT